MAREPRPDAPPRGEQTPTGRSTVLTTLFRHGPMSRAELARTINMTRGSVSELTRSLMADGLIREKGPAVSSGAVGKPSTLIEIIPDGHVIISVDIATGHSRDAARLRGGGYTLFGNPVFQTERRSSQTQGAGLVEEIIVFIRELIAQSTLPVLAVGIATPGIIDAERDVVVRSVNLDWDHVPLAALVSSQVDLPVHIANENHATALGEYMFGDDAGENIFCLTAGESAGAGLVVGGRLVSGGAFAAGEVAHLSIDPAGEICPCGRRGCLELVFNTQHLQSLQLLAPTERDERLELIGTHLGRTFAPVISVVDPDRWVFCSEDRLLDEAFLRGVRAGLDAAAQPVAVDVILHSTAANLAARGAVVVAMQRSIGIL